MENLRLKIAVERNIPFIQGLLESFADVVYLSAEDFTPETVRDVDAMIVRTRTRCNADLLAGSRCRFIATATIGTDHIDLDWCREAGITVVNAPGCNAPAVAQYVFASISKLIDRPIDQYTIGIVGVGHVGSIVERWARTLGMRVLVCDPPRSRAEAGGEWSTLGDIAREADIITFHTPLTREGEDATYHIADAAFFASLLRRPIIIDSARGPVVDTPALVDALDRGLVSHAVIDCWEGEPAVSPELLRRADIATPHIAGYSLEGKIRATQMSLDALTAHFGLPHISSVPAGESAPADPATVADLAITPEIIAGGYNPLGDTAAIKSDPAAFESLRNHYNYRREYTLI